MQDFGGQMPFPMPITEEMLESESLFSGSSISTSILEIRYLNLFENMPNLLTSIKFV